MTHRGKTSEIKAWKILLVEDDEDDYILTRAWLSVAKGSKFDLVWASTFESALDCVENNPLDAILIDYDLGADNGVDLVKELIRRGSRLPLIMLTGRGSFEVDLEAMKAGADDYIAKTEVTPLLLERTIRYAIERKHTEESLRSANEMLDQRVKERTLELEQAYHVLSESQNRLGVVIKTAPIILWSFNKVGIITLWEGHGTELIGTKPGELVGKSALEWYSARPDVHVLMNRALAGEEINQVITDKTGIAFETHFTPQYDELGQIVGVVAVSTDVTERDRAQAQIAFQALLLQHVNDAVLAVDHKNIIRAWNTSAERIYGWSAAEAVNQSISDLLQTVWVDGSRDLTYKALAETGLWQGEVIQKNKAGKNINIDLIVTVLKDETGKTIGYVRVGRDITERKRMEVELREVRRRLLGRTETERIELAQELHDGPMQELYGLVYQIKSLEENVADNDIKGTLESSRDKLQQVINDLRLTASDLRPPALAPFGLYKAIQSHAEQYNRSNPELKVSLDLQEDGLELSEEVRLALFRIYQVALTNVIRHAQATQVDIRFHINEHQILLEVEDNGVGFQASKRWIELAREGHLGLIGASERAESIGGRLKVESQPGKGSTVRVAVPRKKGTGPL